MSLVPTLIIVALTLAHRSIRNRLTALKRDRAEFLKPSDVNALYQAVVKQGGNLLYLIALYISSGTSLPGSHKAQ